jgi:hypothetical protein
MTSLLHPLSLRLRAALAALAFIGTALYAASFILHPAAAKLVPIATGIGLSAGLAWMILGKVLLYTTGRNGPRIMMWFDTCLLTMAAGEVLLLTAAALNLVAHFAHLPIAPSLHLALLLTADAVMGAVFIYRSKRLGISPALAAVLWIAVLNGSLAILLVLFGFVFGYA